jgi:hypothetical protein
MLLDMAARAEAEQASVKPAAVPLTATDQEIVARFIARLRDTDPEETSHAAPLP